MEVKTELIKSPMNYTGGKFKLLPQILPFFPNNINTFVDLFCGGCNVGVNVDCKSVIFNDFMPQIIDLYSNWKDVDLEETIIYIESKIEKYGLSKTNKDGYLALREEYNKNRDIRDLFVLVAYSFNNQIRFNSKGEYNMPFGLDRSDFNKNMKKNLIEFINVIKSKKCYFTNNSFSDLKLDKLCKEDFVYCDPPYLITLASYNEGDSWNENTERELLGLLDRCNDMGIRFALSNVLENKGKENKILKEWCQKYNTIHLNMTYGNCSYHAKDKNKNTTDEVLIINY